MKKEKITLMKYQQELIDKSKKNYMYITDTGTGKSFISLFHYLKYRKPGQKVLIIAPSKKVKEGGWEREIKRLSESNGVEIEYEIHSYDMFRKIIDDVFERKDSSVYNCKNWFLILDEAHFIKNRTSKRSKSFKKMMKYLLKNFVLLTATPTPNGYVDYGSYLEIFKEVESAFHFENEYGKKNSYHQIIYWNNTKEIDEKFEKHTSVPLKKEDCLDLPELVIDYWRFEPSNEYEVLNEVIDKLPMEYLLPDFFAKASDEQKEEAKEEINKIIKDSEKDVRKKIKGKDKIEEELLRQMFDNGINSNPRVLSLQRQYANIREKINFLEEFLEGTRNNVIVFYNFKLEYEIIRDMIENYNKKNKKDPKSIFVINGSMDTLPSRNNWSTLENSVVLVQIQSGGTGIELQFCNEVIYFSPTWNYGDYYQSLGRAYRHGQTKKTSVHFMLAENTFEKDVFEKLQSKKDFDMKTLLKRKIKERKRKEKKIERENIRSNKK